MGGALFLLHSALWQGTLWFSVSVNKRTQLFRNYLIKSNDQLSPITSSTTTPGPLETEPLVLTEWTLKTIYFTIARLNIHHRGVPLNAQPVDRWLRTLLSMGGFYDSILDATTATKIIVSLSQVALVPIIGAFILGCIAALCVFFCCLLNRRNSKIIRTKRLNQPLLPLRTDNGAATIVGGGPAGITPAITPAITPGIRISRDAIVTRITMDDQETIMSSSSSIGVTRQRPQRSSESSVATNGNMRLAVAEEYGDPVSSTSLSSTTPPATTVNEKVNWSSSGLVLSRLTAAFLGIFTLVGAVLCSAGFAIWAVRSVDDGAKIVVALGHIVGNDAADWMARHATVTIGPGLLQYLLATILLYIAAIMNICLELAVKSPYNTNFI